MLIASASGNSFAYLWEDQVPPSFDGSSWAQTLCPRDIGLGLDGLFLLRRPVPGKPWQLEHWDLDGAHTFCGNGTRAALALPAAPSGERVDAFSNGQGVTLRREDVGIGLRMPQGPGFGFQPSPLDLPHAHACAWIGNPQLIVEVPSVDAVDLAVFAPPLRHHSAFPQGTNVCIVEILAPGHARIRSWERGVEGETPSCGTGSAVTGAWLTRRTGVARWRLEPRARDPLGVTAEVLPDGTWRELWLSGAVRVLGEFQPDAGMRLPSPS